MSRGKKVILAVVVLIVVVILAGAIAVPLLLDVDRYRPRVEQALRDQTGKPAQIGHLALSLSPEVSIRVDDFALGNPGGFPQGSVLKIRRIYAVLDAQALWNKQIVIKSLAVDDPVVNLLSDTRGRWNFENAPKAKAPGGGAQDEKPLFSLGAISKVTVRGAQAAAANLLASGRVGPTFFDASDVSIELNQVDVNALVASEPSTSPERTVSAVPKPVASSDAVAYAAESSQQPAAAGALSAKLLRFGQIAATGVKSKVRVFPKQIFLDDLGLEFYGGHAAGDLAIDFGGQNLRYNSDVRLNGVDMARLLAAFPDARGKLTGKMEGHMKVSGEAEHSPDPLAGVRATGTLALRNGQLPTLQLNKNLMLLARFSNLGPASGDPSSFSSISADLNIASGRISSNKVVIVGNGVDVDGSGSISLAGAGQLAYQGVAKLAAGQTPLTNVLIGVLGGTLANGKLSFPFDLAGTLQNPKFILKSAAGAGRLGTLPGLANNPGQQPSAQPGQPQQPADIVKGLAGLFKKKQNQNPPQPPPKP